MSPKTRTSVLILAGAMAFLLAFVGTLKSGESLDPKVRQDFYNGIFGDDAALDRATKAAADLLARDDKNAEAMAWHGVASWWRAGQAFMQGDADKGMAMAQDARQQMDRAVGLEPDNIAVRVPRGTAMIISTRHMEENPMLQEFLQVGLADYEHVLAAHGAKFDSLSTHARGELLFGLAEGWSRAGNEAKAKAYFERIIRELKDTGYARRAETWLARKSLPNADTNCIGCHVK